MKVLVLIVCMVLLSLGVAGAAPAPKLNISHVCNAETGGQTEYHFVAIGLDFDPGAATAVEFWGTKDGAIFGPLNAPWTKTVGNVAHYSLWLDWDSAPIVVAITAATLVLPDLTLELANPSTFTVDVCEKTTAVGLSFFKATAISWVAQLLAKLR